MAGVQIALQRGDQGRAFHRRQQMIEEALLVQFKGRARRGLGVAVVGAAVGAGDVGSLERRLQVPVNDLERVGIRIVDRDLLRGERVLDDLVEDALERQRARGIEAERLQIARQHLHRGNTAAFHRGNELGPGRERKIAGAPEAKPGGVGEVLHRRRAGRRDIEDACLGQRVLQAQSRLALLRRFLLAALPFVAGGIGHRMRFVEHDDAVEVGTKPFDDLLYAALSLPFRLRAQCRVCREQDAFGDIDRSALLEARQRHEVGAVAAQARSSRVRHPRSACRISRSTARGGGL